MVEQAVPGQREWGRGVQGVLQALFTSLSLTAAPLKFTLHLNFRGLG